MAAILSLVSGIFNAIFTPRNRKDRPNTPSLVLDYCPDLDGDPDPGEVVWTWVPFEDDPSQGKDRPVLLVGRIGPDLAGLMLTSKDHDRRVEEDARSGRIWMDIGSGAWDQQRRPSEVRLDRLIPIDPSAVRREGAIVEREMYDQVVARMLDARRGREGW